MEIKFSESSNNSDKTSFGRQLFEQELNFKIAICIINVILCFTALFGNSAILITIWKTSALHSATNILLSSLAVSDLAVGLVGQPLFVVHFLSGIDTVGLLVKISATFLCSTSLITVTAIGVDRLLALQLHLRYHAVVTPFRAILEVIFIWVFSATFTSAKLWSFSSLHDGIASSATIISLLVVNFVVYLKIYLVVRRHKLQIQQQQQQQETSNENTFSAKRFRKSALNTFLVYIFLVCCNMPYSIAVIMLLAGARISTSVYTTTVTLICLNSSLNSLLFCWRDREIRTAMKQLFCRR